MTTLIRKGVHAAGTGLIELAIEREVWKGCSPVLCSAPVALEPPYRKFDAEFVLAGEEHGSREPTAGEVSACSETLVVYAAPDDILTIEWMEDLLRALSVLDGPFAFELDGTADEVRLRFGVPKPQLPGVTAGLSGLFPALRFDRIKGRAFQAGTPSVIEELVPIPPYHRTLTLLGKQGSTPLSVVAKALAELPKGARGVFQVLFEPVHPLHDWHFNIVQLADAEQRAIHIAELGGLRPRFSFDPQKLPPLDEPSVQEKVRVDVACFAAVVRYAAWGLKTPSREAFLQGMRVGTGMLRFGNRAWRRLDHATLVRALGKRRVTAAVARRRSHRPGLILTSRELASLVHIPNARALEMLPALAQRRGLEWLGTEGRDRRTTARLGTNTYAGRERSVEIPLTDRLRHMYEFGTTGSGKSELILNLALDDISNGLGVGLFDPHGDLCDAILARIPTSRMKDLILVSLGEEGYVPRWNPIRSPAPPGKAADDLTRAFGAGVSYLGPRMEHIFRQLCFAVNQLGGTLDDVAELAGRTPHGERLREEALKISTNREARRFLEKDLPGYRASDLDPVRNKLSRMLLDDHLGTMLRQVENNLEPRVWLDEGRVVLVNLNAGVTGSLQVQFIGGLLVTLLYRAALSRSDTPPEDRRPFILYLDEFQLLQSGTLAEIVSEARKYRLGAVFAHQESGQLGPELAQALGNCATTVAFRPSHADLASAQKSLLHRVTAEDLGSLGVGEAFVATGGTVASLKTRLCPYPVLRDPRRAARRYARENYVAVGDTVPAPPSPARPRVYDTFGPTDPELKE